MTTVLQTPVGFFLQSEGLRYCIVDLLFSISINTDPITNKNFRLVLQSFVTLNKNDPLFLSRLRQKKKVKDVNEAHEFICFNSRRGLPST